MANDRLDKIREDLEHELELADAEVNRLKEELTAALEDREAIAESLKALNKKKKGKKAQKKDGPKQDAPKKQQVIAIVSELLEQNAEIPREDLETLVKGKLTEAGTNHNGFGLRFKEAMHDPKFSHDAEGNVTLTGGKVVKT